MLPFRRRRFATNVAALGGAAVGATTTWDPADKSASVTLSNGNLTAASVGDGYARSTTSRTSGNYHFEITLVSTTVSNRTYAGLIDNGSGASLNGVQVTMEGNIRVDSSAVASLNGGAPANGTVIAFEVATATNEAWVQVQGQARQGPYSPSAALTTAEAIMNQNGFGNGTITANFGQSAFAVTPTSGFVAWG